MGSSLVVIGVGGGGAKAEVERIKSIIHHRCIVIAVVRERSGSVALEFEI